MSEERKDAGAGYWAVLPAPVRYDDRISAGSKLIYAEISALARELGYCWAENEYFARAFKITERSVRDQLHLLENAGYIRIETERGNHGVVTGRRIYAGLNPALPPLEEKFQRPTEDAAPSAAPPGDNGELSPKNGGGEPLPLEETFPPLEETFQRHFIKRKIIPPISPNAEAELQKLLKDAPEAGRAVEAAAGENGALLEAWCGYIETRRRKRAPIKTLRTVELLTKKLDGLSGGSDERRIEILNQSVERGWTGLFALKDEQTPDAGGYWAPDPES